MNLVRESILVNLSLFDGLTSDKILELMVAHGFNEIETLTELEILIRSKRVNVVGDKVFFIAPEPEAIDPKYLAAADNFKKSKRNWWQRLLSRFGYPLAFMWVIMWFTVGLCAQEMPSWVLPGMLAVESSSYYNGSEIMYVDQRRGKAGEIGAWQALPATLRQFRFSPSLYEQDTQYAEDATIKILYHYYRVTGSWHEAVASWHRGLGGRYKKAAIKYVKLVKEKGLPK